MALRKCDLRALRKLRERLTMASFGGSNPEEAEYVREATRLWRETWVLPVLDAIIEQVPAESPALKL